MTYDESLETTMPDASAGDEACCAEVVDADAVKANMTAIGSATTGSLVARMSAIGSADTGTFDATASAVGMLTADGDASVSLSAVPIISAKGDASIRQNYTSAIIVGGDVEMSQAFAPIIVGKQTTLDHSAGAVIFAGEATVEKGWVGVVLARDAQISDDSRVLVSTKAALIIAAALLGGFGLIALVLAYGTKQALEWMPNMPDFDELADRWHLRR